jgi:hypothetical protein
MVRILVISGNAFDGHEYRNIPLALELKARGHVVRHAGPSPLFTSTGFVDSTFDWEFANEPGPKDGNTVLFSTWRELYRLILWSDIVVFGQNKAYKGAGAFAHASGRVLVQHQDIGGLDYWYYSPHLLGVRSPWGAEGLAALKVASMYPPVATGSVQFDRAARTDDLLSKEEFCRKYGLNPEKKIAVYFTASPANHSEVYKDTYRKIIQAIEEQDDFQAMIKPHPADYGGMKQEVQYQDTETPTWKQIAPGVPACLPEDTYDCLAHMEVGIARQSHIAFEMALFKKPVVYVDVIEMFLKWVNEDERYIKKVLGTTRYTPPGEKIMHAVGCMFDRLDELPETESKKALIEMEDVYYLDKFWGLLYEYIGTECAVEELPGVLAANGYSINDDTVYDDYITRYCGFNDGLSYKRVADLVEESMEKPELVRKLEKSHRFRWLDFLMFEARELRRKIGRWLLALTAKATPFNRA